MSADHSRERIPGAPRYKKDKTLPVGTEPFWPNFLLKEWIVGSVFLVGFMIWVYFNPVDLTPRANPDDTNFIPVPDWYFLFLYQLLKYFPGHVEAVGTVAVPAVSFLALLLAPWLDIKKARVPGKRKIATVSMLITVIFMSYLTYEARQSYQQELDANPLAKQELNAPPSDDNGGSSNTSSSGGAGGGSASATAVVKKDDPAYKIFQSTCASCHGADLQGGFGPKLLGIGNKMNETQLLDFITKGYPGKMPAGGGLTDPNQIKQVAQWIAQQKQQ
jgi:menaquinol-cytochrome c reductase cytochrome b/c subunit